MGDSATALFVSEGTTFVCAGLNKIAAGNLISPPYKIAIWSRIQVALSGKKMVFLPLVLFTTVSAMRDVQTTESQIPPITYSQQEFLQLSQVQQMSIRFRCDVSITFFLSDMAYDVRSMLAIKEIWRANADRERELAASMAKQDLANAGSAKETFDTFHDLPKPLLHRIVAIDLPACARINGF